MKNIIEKFFFRIKVIFSSIFDPYCNLHWSQEGEDILLKRIFNNKKMVFMLMLGLIILKDFLILINFITKITGMELTSIQI